MADTPRTFSLPGFDGAALAVHELGDPHARPVLLLHGLFSSAQVNWIKYGTAQRLVDAGLRVIMPDLRAHGLSAAPHDPAAYPPDVLKKDALALIAALGIGEDFDLGGFSLGARTSAALVADGLRPCKLVLGGMGLSGLTGWEVRRDFFLHAIDHREDVKRDDPHFMAVMFMKTMKIDPVAARLLLSSPTAVAVDALAAVDLPVQLVCGADDHDNGSAPELAAYLRNARYDEIPGTHMSCITQPELGQAMADFLAS